MNHDCIVIGAGHNGLVCAQMLARAGRKVLVLERAKCVGGAAATVEFVPGFKVSAGAHLLHSMPASLVSSLKLDSHGLRFSATGMSTAVLERGSAPRLLGAGLSSQDGERLSAFENRMRKFAAALKPVMETVPPRLGTPGIKDGMTLLRLAFAVRRLGRRDMREFLRIVGMNAYDLLEEHFDSEGLKGAFGLDAVLGANFGPRSPGTVLTLLHRMAGQNLGEGGLRQPEGGMGALCEALARAAVASGAEVRTDAPVSKLMVKDDRVCGVQLSNGERLGARIVVSNADPKTTFLKLLGAAHLDTGFVRRITHLRTKGLAAKLHLALDAAPKFGGEPSLSRGRMLIAPSLNHIERAFNHSKYGEFSADPVMEITVPTLNDPTLAPQGKHVLSAVVQYAPYTLKGGWEQGRAAFTDAAIDVLERHAPGLRAQILAAEILTPVDIEEKFGIDGGHWHHADLAFDQFLMMRPVPGVAQHRAPIAGLYLCGAGCHPGGGVMGIAGSSAAREVLAAGAEA